ncbi:MAG: DUF2171 domain-containing protein [Gaiellaceae bacterium]
MSHEGDPASWLVVEPGWRVVDVDGNEVGRVEQVVGDSNADIFSGILISTGLFTGHRFVPSDDVGAINEGRVHLLLDGDAIKQLSDETGPQSG